MVDLSLRDGAPSDIGSAVGRRFSEARRAAVPPSDADILVDCVVYGPPGQDLDWGWAWGAGRFRSELPAESIRLLGLGAVL